MKIITKILKWVAISIGVIIILWLILIPFYPSVRELPIILYQSNFKITTFEVRGDELYINGGINSKTYAQFVDIFNEHPNIHTLVEVKVPGSIDDDTMIRLAYFIRKEGLNTKLLAHSEIYSGGVDLFLAGVERTMEEGAIIGVHSWGGPFDVATDYPKGSPEHEQNRKYIEDMLGSDEFYWFTIYAAKADDIHEMTKSEIIQYGLLTEDIKFTED